MCIISYMETKLLYLHGFNSSPKSFKAQLFVDYFKKKGRLDLLVCPQIPTAPEEAIDCLEQIIIDTQKSHQLNIVGSSLGGYYASYLAEKHSRLAVLVNPSVQPYETLKKYLGENKYYYEDGFWEFEEKHIALLESLDVKNITPERYMVLLQTGDESLNYKEAALKYNSSQCIIEQGGSHSFTGFDNYLEKILDFVQVKL